MGPSQGSSARWGCGQSSCGGGPICGFPGSIFDLAFEGPPLAIQRVCLAVAMRHAFTPSVPRQFLRSLGVKCSVRSLYFRRFFIGVSPPSAILQSTVRAGRKRSACSRHMAGRLPLLRPLSTVQRFVLAQVRRILELACLFKRAVQGLGTVLIIVGALKMGRASVLLALPATGTICACPAIHTFDAHGSSAANSILSPTACLT